MKTSLSLLAGVTMLALFSTRMVLAEAPAGAAADKVVHGVITAMEGNTLAVGDVKFVLTETTSIEPNRDALKVGVKISARLKNGAAVRIEVHKAKSPAADVVHGVITAMEGNTLAVGDVRFVLTETTSIEPNRDALKVGVKISARLKNGAAVRIEVHKAQAPVSGDK